MRPRDEITTKMIAKRNEVAVLVANLTGVPVDDIMGRCRRQDISTARQLVMWALVALFGYTHTQVGMLMRRNHATVTYGVNHVRWGYNAKKVEKLKEQFKQAMKGE